MHTLFNLNLAILFHHKLTAFVAKTLTDYATRCHDTNNANVFSRMARLAFVSCIYRARKIERVLELSRTLSWFLEIKLALFIVYVSGFLPA